MEEASASIYTASASFLYRTHFLDEGVSVPFVPPDNILDLINSCLAVLVHTYVKWQIARTCTTSRQHQLYQPILFPLDMMRASLRAK
jgi:hypothetical protein